MRFHLFLLLVFSSYQHFTFTNALFNYNNNNTSLDIELHQCDTNITLVHNITIAIDQRFDSCKLNCCIKNQSIFSNVCQVTSQSRTGVCLGRLCYPGECDHFFSSMNRTFNQTTKSSISMINTIRSSLSSFVSPQRIVWPLWRDRSYLSIRYNILILLLIANFFFTLITLFIIIKSIRHAQILAARKLRRYSLF